jgi:hypothetical protein
LEQETPWTTLENLLKLRRTFPQRGPVQYAQHGDVSAHAQWRQVEVNQSLLFIYTHFSKKARLHGVQFLQNGAACMINCRSSICNETQQLGLVQQD